MRIDNDNRVYMMDHDDKTVVYLKNVITDPDIHVGAHTIYNDFEKDPRDFQKNNILYHVADAYRDQIIIGKYCSLAKGTTFMCTPANHNLRSLSTYPFGVANEYWELPEKYCRPDAICELKDKGPTIVGNDVWFGYQSLVFPGVHIGDGAIIGARSVVISDVEPYTIVAGSPARPIRKRFDDETIEKLLKIKWWDLSDDDVKKLLPYLIDGDIDKVIEQAVVIRVTNEILKYKNDLK